MTQKLDTERAADREAGHPLLQSENSVDGIVQDKPAARPGLQFSRKPGFNPRIRPAQINPSEEPEINPKSTEESLASTVIHDPVLVDQSFLDPSTENTAEESNSPSLIESQPGDEQTPLDQSINSTEAVSDEPALPVVVPVEVDQDVLDQPNSQQEITQQFGNQPVLPGITNQPNLPEEFVQPTLPQLINQPTLPQLINQPNLPQLINQPTLPQEFIQPTDQQSIDQAQQDGENIEYEYYYVDEDGI